MKLSKNFWYLFFCFVFLRLIFIFTFPPFTDESVHIRWGRLMLHAGGFAWSSLPYLGKQPLAFWLFAVMGDLVNNPLIGGRLVTLLVSIPCFFILYKLSNYLGLNQKIRTTSLYVLTFCPIFILFQSLVLMDAFLLTATLLIILLLFIYKQSAKLIYLFFLGFVTGVTFWIKSNIIVILFPVIVSLFYIELKIFHHKLINIFKLLIPAFVFLLIAIPLLLQPGFQRVTSETNNFTYSLNGLMEFPTEVWLHNSFYTFLTLLIYLSPLVLLFVIFALLRIKNRIVIFLFSFFLLSLMPVIVLGKNFTGRYFLFSLAPLIPLLAIGAEELFGFFRKSENLVRKIYYVTLIVYSLFFILFPLQFFSLFSDKLLVGREKDYILTNGYGSLKAVEYFNQMQNKNAKTLVLVPDRQGNPTDYLLAYYYFNPDILVTFLSTKEELKKLDNILGKTDIYFVSRKSALPSDLIPYLTEVKSFPEPGSSDATVIFLIKK